ncbi:MAG: thioredoxin family protein [Nitrospirae bacterium]|nr:thioredoxin family protein [Nitrospirota bacterium]
MAVLQVFVHHGCMSGQHARVLAEEIMKHCPGLQVEVVEDQHRAQALGVVVLPAFVLNGKVIAVGVPRKEWLVRKLRERNQRAGC